MNEHQSIAHITEDGEVLTEEQIKQRKLESLEKLYIGFSGMRDRWVQYRAASGIESRWRKANELFHGNAEIEAFVDSFEDTLRNGPSNKNRSMHGQPRSRVVVNIVRPKVEQAVARLCEILFPVDDRNWGIKPTPVPELAERVGNKSRTIDPQTGRETGLTADQEAQAIITAAKEAAERMQRAIDDNLTECQYNGECRKVIEDGVRLGTGIIKGPFPRRKRNKRWKTTGNVATLEFNEKITPASKRVDPWDIFFDPACGDDHQRGRGVFERSPVTRKELRRLIGIPGYDADAIRKVLLCQPTRVQVAEGRVTRQHVAEEAYEMWGYHGEIEPDDFMDFYERLGLERDFDPLKVTSAAVIMVNDTIIGVLPSWVVDGELPYDVWPWRKADDSPHGYGLSDELEHQQRVVNGAWRQLMDNGRNSMGGQIVMRKGDIIPADGRYTLTPMKVWLAKDEVVDVNKAFSVFEFQSHIDELLKVAQAALNFADMESGIPQLMGGEQGQMTPETVGGMLLLYNNANSVLRRRVKLYDDQITRPHVGRYYDFKMANDQDDRIKGDFDVDARGSSALVERDIQNQAMINLASITSNPRYAPHMRDREELKAILKAFKIDPEDLMKTEEQVEQDLESSPPPQDPKIVAAEMNMQAKQLDLDDRERQRQFEAERNTRDDEFRNRQLAYNAQREQAEFEIAMTDSSIKRDTALLRENVAMVMSREANASRERLGMLNIETKRQIFNAEAQLRTQTGSGI